MKIPAVGEVKNKNVAIGAGVVGVIVLVAYMRKKKASATPAAADAGAVDPNAIDPSTGVPYGQEVGSGGYYVGSSVPNPYVSQTGTQTTTGTGGAYANNELWLAAAIQDATNLFGVSYALATMAFGKYLAQTPSGLNPNEYAAVSEVVATIGQPPNGGPFRLIQAAPSGSTTSSSGGETDAGGGTSSGGGVHEPDTSPPQIPLPPPSGIPAGYHMQNAQVATLEHGRSLRNYAQGNYPSDPQGHLNILIGLNPGLNPDDISHPTMFIKTSDPHLVPNF